MRWQVQFATVAQRGGKREFLERGIASRIAFYARESDYAKAVLILNDQRTA